MWSHVEGTYLGKARSLGELGAHVFLIHANHGSVQFLSSLQVSFQQRTLEECVVGSSEAPRYQPLPRRFPKVILPQTLP